MSDLNSKMPPGKQKHGKGRFRKVPYAPPPSSRLKYLCNVDGCPGSFRSDDLRKKEYHVKLLKSGLFVSKDLKEYKLGAAVRGRRLKEEKVSKLPIQVWARWAELTK